MENINKTSDKLKLVNVNLGKNVKFYDFVNAYGCTIGEGTRIGTFVEIQKNSFIGKNCKISSHTFICEGVNINDNVFIGHGVMFTNDLFPRATNLDGSMQTDTDWVVVKTYIEKNVAIGSNATILAGIVIGENSIIGAGSVVTKNVKPNSIYAGNPAKFLRELEN